MENSEIVTFEYTVSEEPEQVATPTADVLPGSVSKDTPVTLACATDGATIYYTTDGFDPTASGLEYTGAIIITDDMTIKAIAVKEGMEDSKIATFEYTVSEDIVLQVATPTADVLPGSVAKIPRLHSLVPPTALRFITRPTIPIRQLPVWNIREQLS